MAIIPVMSTIILRIPLPVVVHDEQLCTQQSMECKLFASRKTGGHTRDEMSHAKISSLPKFDFPICYTKSTNKGGVTYLLISREPSEEGSATDY